MAKTISLPNSVYEDLEAITQELTTIAKKPISMSMAVYLITAVYRAHLSEPCARDAFRQRLASMDLLSPEEFERACDSAPNKGQKKPKKKKKSQRRKSTKKQ
jgi:hypothetical protein